MPQDVRCLRLCHARPRLWTAWCDIGACCNMGAGAARYDMGAWQDMGVGSAGTSAL